jgi:6,7-dimethyl-8-ribityllumazine synthase
VSSSLQNLSSQKLKTKIDFSNKMIGIVVAEWNSEVTDALYNGAIEVLLEEGVKKDNIISKIVPGTFELSLGAQWLAQKNDIDAVIVIGCVIMGDTPHFDYICQSVSYGITEVGLKHNKPVVFGVLTTLTLQQALDRAGGKHGNKGNEASMTALKMLSF